MTHRSRLLALFPAAAIAASLAVSASPASAAECPNEALRQESNINPIFHVPFSAQLPDCRAFEMVSPTFKTGGRTKRVQAMNSDGTRLLFNNIGVFGGTESLSFEGTYEAVRTSSGWKSKGINPPGSVFSAVDDSFSSVSTDGTRTLWALRRPSECIRAKNLFIREPDGAFTEIGPTIPPYVGKCPPSGSSKEFAFGFVRYAGADNQLSHVLYYSERAPKWEGDTTIFESPSLYDYVGTGNTHPYSVGVSDGHTHGQKVVGFEEPNPGHPVPILQPAVVPEGSAISDCGTELGEEKDVYNAISGDGSVVYFMAQGLYTEGNGEPELSSSCANGIRNSAGDHFVPEYTELYARINNGRTVAISEPTSAQCSACDTSIRRAAQFRGASEDGSKVFFLTKQHLLGGEGTNLYEYDSDQPPGEEVIRVTKGATDPEIQGVARVSNDGSHVYFVAKAALTGANLSGRAPVAGAENLYVFQRDAEHPAGQLDFIATLSEADASSVWRPDSDQHSAQATPDGRYLAFTSAADLLPGETSPYQRVFEYDAASEELVRISIGQAGYPAGESNADQAPAQMPTQEFAQFGWFPQNKQVELSLTADGRQVVFTSPAALTPQAEPAAEVGAESVYLYSSVGTISDGDVSLLSDGINEVTPQADPAGLTPDGATAYFLSFDRISPTDGDDQADLYTARVDGGFKAPQPPLNCELSAACQGAPTPAPVVAGPTTPSFSGPPNPTPKHKRKTKPKHKKRRHQSHHRPTGANPRRSK